MTLSFVYHVDLPETWSDLKKALNQIAPQNALLSQLLGKVLLHHISAGIQHAGALPDEKKAEELRTFLHNTPDLKLGKSAEEIMRDAQRGVLFREVAALSETDCGTFWTELLSTRPVEDYYNLVDLDGLFELLSELSSAYVYFGGKRDAEMGEAQDYQNALEEAYNTHCQNKVLLHPDVERAKRLLAQGKFPDYEDICREILLVEYPEEVPHETAEEFDELSWERVLDDVFARDPEKGMKMWRRLLDIAEPSLKTDAKTAGKLLPDWDWLESPTDDQALPLLVALDDERFVPRKQAIFPQYKAPEAKKRYAQVAHVLYLGDANSTEDERVELLLKAVADLKATLDIPSSIREYGIDEKTFKDNLDKLTRLAFDDQCTGANPVYPLMSEIKQIYLDAYEGKY